MDLNKSLEVKTKNVNHIKNLIAIASIDGDFASSERSLIYEIGLRYGLTDFEVNQLMTNPSEANLLIPDTEEKRIQHLDNYIELIVSDGKVMDEELDFCKIIANVLGFDDEMVVEVLEMKYGFSA